MNNDDRIEKYFFRSSAREFYKIPGNPIAYWISPLFRSIFENIEQISHIANAKQGLATGDNNRFLRVWSEVGKNRISFMINREETTKSQLKWVPYNKGGEYRKWYGNQEFIVNWEDDGYEIKHNFNSKGKLRSRPQNTIYYFKESVSWSDVTSSKSAFRYYPEGFIFDSTGHSAFVKGFVSKEQLLLCCNNKFTEQIISILNPTMHFHVGYFNLLPAVLIEKDIADGIADDLIKISKSDWDSYETSWDFTSLPLLSTEYRGLTLSDTYTALREHWNGITLEMRRLEEENNRVFIEAYGLADEITPDVPLKEITLTCNPHYRYSNNKSNEGLEPLLQADTMKEYISYAVGCMFGRYALEKPGLILANQGETFEDYLSQVPSPLFPADADNIIPILDGEWFSDNMTSRFKSFVKLTFGGEFYGENIGFIEKALGKSIEKYFLTDFYKDHVKRYKKRPIYWMFSSPKGSFNALIYIHRYRPDTVSVILNNYLREYKSKLGSQMQYLQQVEASVDSGRKERTQALKKTEKIKKILHELESYEKDIIYPLALEQIEIDLDDGVKVNYPKFGKALKNILGLS